MSGTVRATLRSEEVCMKDVIWVGDSRERLRRFPKAARQAIGKVLEYAQLGDNIQLQNRCEISGQEFYRLLLGIPLCLPGCLYGEHPRAGVCITLFREEIVTRDKNPKREIDLIRQRLRRARGMEATYV